jgi:hypothetical protein
LIAVSSGRRLRGLVAWASVIAATAVVLILFFGDNLLSGPPIRVLGNVVIPAFMAFGWKYVLGDFEDQAKFLARWSAMAQAACLCVNLATVRASAWGLTGPAILVLTSALVLIYVKGFYEGWLGGLLNVALMILNTGLSYLLILSNLDNLSPWLVDPSSPDGKNLLGYLLSDIGQIGTMAVLTPQIFLRDYVGRIREQRAMERLMELLDEDKE